MWIGLITGEAGRAERCESLILQAKKGEIEIWTSSLALAEVYKFKSGGVNMALPVDQDTVFQEFVEQPFVVEVEVDHTIGVEARRLLRAHSPPLKKPNDAIHLATAVVNNVDELYTFDTENLTPLDGLVSRSDGQALRISEPPPPVVAEQTDMFATSDQHPSDDEVPPAQS